MAPPGNVLESTAFGPERQDRLMRRGLFAIQQVATKDEVDLLHFPVRLDGSTGLPRQVQELFTELLQGESLLQSVTEPDATMAQRYLDWLALPQLLRIRCTHVHGQFLTKALPVSFTRALDHRLTDTIAERLLGSEANLKTSRRLVRVVTLIYGVQASMHSEPREDLDWWSHRVGGERWFLSLSNCKLTRTAPESAVYCYRVLSVDREMLKWQVSLVRDVDRWEADLCSDILPAYGARDACKLLQEPEGVKDPHSGPSTSAAPCQPATSARRDTPDADAARKDALLRSALQAAEEQKARLCAEVEEAQKHATQNAKTAEDEAKEREAKLRAELDEAKSCAADAAAARQEAQEIEEDALALFEENRRLMEVLCRLMEALGLAAPEVEQEPQEQDPVPAPPGAGAGDGCESGAGPEQPPRRRVEDILGGKRASQKQAGLAAPERLADAAAGPHFSRCATAGGG